MTGTSTAFGGSGHECGGAGTILYREHTDGVVTANRLIVDNDASRDCTALDQRISYADLSDLSRGSDSYRTYIHDTGSSHEHEFAEVSYCNQLCNR